MVGVVLINYNSWQHTVECVESILRSDYMHFQVVIVDNGSADQSASHVEAWARGDLCAWVSPASPMRRHSFPPWPKPVTFERYEGASALAPRTVGAAPANRDQDGGRPRVTYIDARDNLGFGAGNDLGIRFLMSHTSADLIWLLNNDTVIAPDAMAAMVRAATPGSAIVGSVLMHYAEPERIQAYGGGRVSRRLGTVKLAERDGDTAIDFVHGASLLLDRESVAVIGGFDPHIHMYAEEIDLCFRAQRAGIPLRTANALVYHKGGGSAAPNSNTWRQVYPSLTYVLEKHLGLGTWVPARAVIWLINWLRPGTDPGKRRASRDALWSLLRALPDMARRQWRSARR